MIRPFTTLYSWLLDGSSVPLLDIGLNVGLRDPASAELCSAILSHHRRTPSADRRYAGAVGAGLLACLLGAAAQENAQAAASSASQVHASEADDDALFASHGQTTVAGQAVSGFRSPDGLTPRQAKETVDISREHRRYLAAGGLAC